MRATGIAAVAWLTLAAAAWAVPPKTFTAPDLAQPGGPAVIEDWAPVYLPPNYNGKRVVKPTAAVALTPGGATIKLDLGELPISMYYVDVIARWNREVPPAERDKVVPYQGDKGWLEVSGVDQVRRPVYLHVRVNDGPGGVVSDYRMLVLYTDFHAQVTRVFFQINEPRRVRVEVAVAKDSLEGLRVKEVRLADFLDGIGRGRGKQRAVLASAEGRERERKEALAKNPGLKPVQATPLPAEERRKRDDLIWNGFPRLNTQVYCPAGGEQAHFFLPDLDTASGGVRDDKLKALAADPRFKNLGLWRLEGENRKDYHGNAWSQIPNPLDLVHDPDGAKYTMEQLYRSEPLPNRPFAETPTGAFFPAKDVPALGRSHYLFTIGDLLWKRYYQYYLAITDDGGSHFGLKLSGRYHLTGDANAARDASMMLARMAYQWPALQLMWQDLGQMAANPNLTYGINTRGGWKDGKIYYSGWSGPMWSELLRAYDRLFDFIDGNQELAQAIHRYVPWVKTPDDVVAFFDTYLIRAGMKDYREKRIHGDYFVVAKAALVLGSGPEVADCLDIAKSTTTVYPFPEAPVLDLYSCAYNRDGTHYIGSTSYARGGAFSLLEFPELFLRLKAEGRTFPLDMSDTRRFPKVAAAASTILDMQVAAGYYLPIGDASGALATGRTDLGVPGLSAEQANSIYNLTHDPRYAWLLANVYGRSGQTEAKWEEVTAAAAVAHDPRLHQRSRVLGGFGAAVLEAGEEFRDFRLKEAVILRTGAGQGHVHADALDLDYFALGCRMTTDIACRTEGPLWTEPPAGTTYVHNMVEVDGKRHPWRAEEGWNGGRFGGSEAWVEAFKPLPGALFMMGRAASITQSDVGLYRREVAHIRVADGREGAAPLPEKLTLQTRHPQDAVLPQAYIFDVFRVGGGRWHTWCFHGCASDEFLTTPALRPLPADAAKDTDEDKLSRAYLRKHDDPCVGKGADVIEATWRLSREPQKFTTARGEVTATAAEPAMLGASFDKDAPRRYTRVTLLGHPGAVVLSGAVYSQAYSFHLPFLYVQERVEQKGQQSVFPSIIEAYQDKPAVMETLLLDMRNNEADALRAVAVEVKTAGGRTDICFAGGRPEKVRELAGGEKLSGLFAFVSRDGQGLRQATLVGGPSLTAKDISIAPAKAKHAGRIIVTDYAKLQCTVLGNLPESLAGEEALIFNKDHRTSYTIASVENREGQATVTFTRTADQGRAPVSEFANDTLTLPYGPFGGHEFANRNKGYTVTNESKSKSWKLAKVWMSAYTLDKPLTPADLDDADGDGRKCVEFYDYGVGDMLEVPVHVSVRRLPSGEFEVRSDVEAEVLVGGKRLPADPARRVHK